jgi:hypothetical protein
LADWQDDLVKAEPERFLRGLSIPSAAGSEIASAGTTGNTCTRVTCSLNESADIMDLCRNSLNQLGISWRMSRHNTLSIAQREAVARLDEFIGPKW